MKSNKFKRKPSHAQLLVVLAAMTMFVPMSTDMYLPSFPAVAQALHVHVVNLQLTLTSFMLGTGLGQILYGPISDRFGRKKPSYFGILIFVIASLLCTAATTLPTLIAYRFLQAFGGSAALVCARAIVRDLLSGVEMAKMMSAMSMLFVFAPAFAPTIGSTILHWTSWHGVFFALVLFGALVAIGLSTIPESLTEELRNDHGIKQAFENYTEIISNKEFRSASVITMGGSFVTFAYVSSSPAVLMGTYGVSRSKFGILFGLISIEFKATGGAGGYRNWKITGLPANITSTAVASVLKVRGKSPIEARYFLKVYVEDRKGASSTITEVLTISNGPGGTSGGGISGTSQISDPGFTNIAWLPQAGAKTYDVVVNGKVACSTSSTNCVIQRLVGPKSNVAIVTHLLSGKVSLPDPIRYLPPAKPVQIAVANFDLNKSILKPKDMTEISKVAKLMEAEGYTSIQVIGHTDSSGSNKINGPLSEARASAVFKYLQKILTGTPISVELIGKSSTEPVASNATDSGRAANRRAVLSLR